MIERNAFAESGKAAVHSVGKNAAS